MRQSVGSAKDGSKSNGREREVLQLLTEGKTVKET